jgi:hypothetical protein
MPTLLAMNHTFVRFPNTIAKRNQTTAQRRCRWEPANKIGAIHSKADLASLCTRCIPSQLQNGMVRCTFGTLFFSESQANSFESILLSVPDQQGMSSKSLLEPTTDPRSYDAATESAD